MTQIQSSDIFMQERLFEKYFEDNDEGSMIALSREEDAFIKSKVSAKVLLCTDERPIAYQEGSSIGGIVPDYLEILKEKSGLSFDLVAYKNHEEMLKAFQEGKGELCAQFPDDFQFSEDQKAMMAKAIANELNGAFFSVKCSDILSKWLGESEQNIKNLFATARQYPVSVIFFDEFEAIGASREDTDKTQKDIVPEILAQMQGFESYENTCICIAATNRPWRNGGLYASIIDMARFIP